jgi:hypothetical protein
MAPVTIVAALRRLPGQPLQKFQLIKQAVHIGRVLTYLKLAQPDETTDVSVGVFGQQGIKSVAGSAIQPPTNPVVIPPLGGNKRVRTPPHLV